MCPKIARVAPNPIEPWRVLTNTARIGAVTSDRDPSNNKAWVTTTVQTAAAWVEKKGPAWLAAGEPLTYRLSYGNEGAAPAAQVYRTDSFPAGTNYNSDNSGLPGIGIPGGRRWTVGLLKPSFVFSFVLTLTLVADLPPGALLTDTFTIHTICDLPAGFRPVGSSLAGRLGLGMVSHPRHRELFCQTRSRGL